MTTRAFVLLFVCMAAVPSSMAQSGVDMGCSPTLASPCGSSSDDNDDRDTRDVEDVAPPDPLQEYLPRYSTALQRLQAMVGGLDDVASAAPQSLSEMSARLSVIYVGAAYRLDSITAARNQAAQTRAQADESTQADADRMQRFKDKMATSATRKAEAAAKLKSLQAEQARLAAIKSSLDSRRTALAKTADVTTDRIVHWLAIAGLPKAQRPTTPFVRQRPPVEDYLPPELSQPSDGPVFVVPDTPRLPGMAGDTVEFRAPIGGTVDQKLAAVESLAPQIDAAARALEQEQPDAADAEARANATEIALRTTTQLFRDVEGEVRGVENRVSSTDAVVAITRQDSATAARNMLREAVEVTILNRLEPKAVAAVKEFLTINGDAKQIATLTDERVAALYKAGQVALRLPVGTQIKGMQKFLEAQQSILAYVKNPLQSAIDGGNALGTANPNGGAAEALAVFRGLRHDALQITEAATKTLPGGARVIAAHLVDEAEQ